MEPSLLLINDILQLGRKQRKRVVKGVFYLGVGTQLGYTLESSTMLIIGDTQFTVSLLGVIASQVGLLAKGSGILG